MLSPHEKSPKPKHGLTKPRTFNINFRRTVCVTVAAGCLAVAPVGLTGVSHRVMAQVANPSNEDAFATMDATARLLTQATFGPNPDEVMALTGSSPSQWLLAEFSKDASLNLPIITAVLAQNDESVGCPDSEADEGEDGEDDDVEDGEDGEDDDLEDGDENVDDEESEDEEDSEESEEDDEDLEGDDNEESEDGAEDDEDGEGEEGGEGDDEEEDACTVGDAEPLIDPGYTPQIAFWTNAIAGSDQVRQRMAFALSQIMVISNSGGEFLTDTPPAVGYYQDVLTSHALGNYRDLLEAATYAPAMGYYLTYLGNRKGDPATGRVPDENYARELMQLFTIGLVELNMDGTEKTDASGNAIETYTNDDITGLARVFTGLAVECFNFDDRTACDDIVEDEELTDEEFGEVESEEALYTQPMKMFETQHSALEKSFLGTTIPAGTSGVDSVTMALDTIFNHSNVPPFVSRQLIQRFVTSHPSPEYIERVATAFAAGSYTLPDGSVVGDGRRGDLQATVAAILFDDEARSAASLADDAFGKVREPVIRFTNWARAFNVSTVTPEYQTLLQFAGSNSLLGQQPYGASSVFNFYRPGYVAPGTLTGAAGLTVPELQIVNAATTPGYVNFMTAFITGGAQNSNVEELEEIAAFTGATFDAAAVQNSFRPNYDFEFDLAMDAEALVDRVEAVMTYITLSPESKTGIIEAINAIPFNMNDNGLSAARRVHLAILMVMTTPDYLVQR